MKLKQLYNLVAVFMLSAIAALLYFSDYKPQQKVDNITLPQLVDIKINQKSFITKLSTSDVLSPLIVNILKQHHIDYNQIISKIYVTHNGQYLMAFLQNAKNETQFVLFKKNVNSENHIHLQIVASMNVLNVSDKAVQFSYGAINFIQESEPSSNTIQLAQTLNIEESL